MIGFSRPPSRVETEPIIILKIFRVGVMGLKFDREGNDHAISLELIW